MQAHAQRWILSAFPDYLLLRFPRARVDSWYSQDDGVELWLGGLGREIADFDIAVLDALLRNDESRPAFSFRIERVPEEQNERLRIWIGD
jgi:hypothetical protein